MNERTYLIVGASLAGVRAAEAMRQRGFDGRIVLLGAERELPYHRPPLSKEFLGDTPLELGELAVQPADFYEDAEIELRLGERAITASARDRRVELASGETVGFDRLLVATGSTLRRLTVPGSELRGVHYLRTLEDALSLRAALAQARRVTVVGAGLIALEVGAAARSAGKEVTVVLPGSAPLRRLLGDRFGRAIASLHEDHGVRFHYGASATRVLGAGQVEAVELSDGVRLATELLLVAIGVNPATDWLGGSGIRVEDGVVVDASGATNVPGVFAAGDVASSYSTLYDAHLRIEQYGNAHAQGALVGRNMVGGPAETHAAIPSASSEHYGVRIQFIGRAQGSDETFVRGSPGDHAFTVLYLKDGAARAALCVARPSEFAAARKLVSSRARLNRALLRDGAVPLAAVVDATL